MVTATSKVGRDSTISSAPTDETAPLNLKFTVPKALGGRGDSGHNPEQLFAAGYSSSVEFNISGPRLPCGLLTSYSIKKIQRASWARSKPLRGNGARKKSASGL